MKRCALFAAVAFVILSAGCAWGGVSLSAFPDPVFREALKYYDRVQWAVDSVDSDGNSYVYEWGKDDGILDDKEIEHTIVLDIDCSYPHSKREQIQSLKGIEYLTALKCLRCGANQLTELDLSNNNSLELLSCYVNQLTALDLSNNTALTALACDSNRLTELNLSHNTALTNLHCSNNQLTTLDVSKNTALTWLNCEDNQLTELDLSNNTSLSQAYCGYQKRSGLKVKKTSEGYYEVNMKDYVSHPENIDADSISPQPVSYSKETGIITFSEPITALRYNYMTHSPNNDLMDVTITNPLSIAALERKGSETYGIICDMTESSYVGNNGNALTESDISSLSYSDYGKLGLTADGNSRLILRVQTHKPGTVSFSFNDDIGAKLESLTSRKELSASDQLNTTEINSDTHQVSAVLVAPERFPEDKNFPSDTFKVHVKFTDEDGKVTEDDLELKLEAAPVLLIPGRMNMSFLGAILNPGDANHTFGVKSKTGIYGELLKIGFKEEHIAALDYYDTRVMYNTYRLSNYLQDMFDSYDEEGIVCTKADVVAHGLGGLLVRKFLDGLSGEYNYKYRSYKQPPIRRVVNIAVPHRGTPLANVMLGDMSVINDDLPLGTDRLAYRYLKYFPSTFTAIFNGASKAGWEDLAVGSEVTSLPFPAKVPMHFIYGDVTHSLDTLENMKDLLFLAFNVYKLIKAVGPSIAKYQDLTSYLEDLGILKEFAHLQGKYLDNFQLLEALAMLDKEVLRVMAEQKDIITGLVREVMEKFGIPFAQMASNSPTFTGLIQIGSVAMGGAAGLLTTPIDLFFVIQRLIFSGQPHDTFVPKWSATAAFPEYSTGFPITPGIFDFWHFKYGEICHQNDVAEFVGYLLKDAPLSKFAVLEESLPLPGSVSAKTSSNGDSDSDIDIDFENFYVKNFSLAIRKSTRENFGEGMTALKFIAETTIKTSNDVKLVVQKDSLDRIFPMFSENGVRFESLLVFSSSDEGAMTAYCYAPSGKGNLYISDTVNVDVSAAIDEDTQEELPPEILTETLTNAITNQSYSLQLTASGTTPITWTHTGKLPAGLSLSESGLISGTPARAGKSSFTVTAQNSFGKTSRPFTLQTFDPVTITTASLKAGTIGKSYSVTMRAKGSKTITWSAEGLPNGLSINAKGKISGKPSAYGKFTVKIAAQNGAGSITKSLQLEIKAIAPTLSGTLAKPTLNVPYSSGLKLSKGSTPITWSVQGNLPGGLTLDSSTGIISGTPTSYDKSGFKIIITATNDAGSKSKNITLKVNGKAPKITAKLPQATAGENYSAELSASGSEPITFAAELPEYLTLDGSTINGTVPDSVKSFKITAYASNPVKKNVKKNYTIKVSTKKSLPENLDDDNNTDIIEINKGVNSGVITDVPSFTENSVYSYSESYVIVAELGVISSDEEGMHEFGVALPDYVPEGSELVYISNSDEPSEDDEIAEFYDDEGNEISKVPESRKITVSIWLNPERVYNPAIGIKR